MNITMEELVSEDLLYIMRDYEHHKHCKQIFIDHAESQDWPQSYKTNVMAKMSDWKINSDSLDIFSEWVKSLIPYPNMILDDIWYAKYDKGEYTKSHFHLPHTFSFVYFLNSPTGSSPLVFTTSGVEVEPVEGRIVIFLSSLYHHVPKNDCDGRMVIAGNMSWRSRTVIT